MNTEMIKDLLRKAKSFKELSNKHEDEVPDLILRNIYKGVLDYIGVEEGTDLHDDCANILFEYDVDLIDENKVISELKRLKNGL